MSFDTYQVVTAVFTWTQDEIAIVQGSDSLVKVVWMTRDVSFMMLDLKSRINKLIWEFVIISNSI